MSRSQRTNAATDDNSAADQPAKDGGPARTDARPRASVAWTRSGTGYSTTIDGREYRVTKYPADSPLAAPFGAYAEGRFIGSGTTFDVVKSRCAAHAGKLRLRNTRGAPKPEPDRSTRDDSRAERAADPATSTTTPDPIEAAPAQEKETH